MIDFSLVDKINPYVRMMRLKRSAAMSGKWKDIDNVFTYVAAGFGDFRCLLYPEPGHRAGRVCRLPGGGGKKKGGGGGGGG
ncbi:MAG: hypothetical protein K2N82_15485, partial [Lachnospiraceae bacterium]|nr:hypothetical protein [Lachnospiraceae bacterium]